jgi:MinD-like ATPase involved in chromosome partitioning or flagellar assembly
MSEQARRDLLDAPSFLASPTVDEPAQRGFAGFMNHFGLHLAPGTTERDERTDIAGISRHFDAHRTISVINRKGGANKTPTVVNLAAVFARYGGGGVLAWDNNETMGTLGWRTEQGGHGSTVLDVLAGADELLDARAEFGQMSAFVHHQQADKFDVLRSDEDVSGTHEMTADEVDVVHSIAAKYYRLIFMDSGNSDRAENWLRMLDHTDQLVVPTTTMEDRAQAALLTLQAVQSRSEKAAELARNAVVVVSEWQPKESSISQRMADDFRPYVRDVVIVPFDPALKAGRIQYDGLQPATRRAWVAAAAAVARGL